MGKVVPINDVSAELVDEFAPVRLAVAAFGPTTNAHDRLRKRTKVQLDRRPGTQPATLGAHNYGMEIAACEMEGMVKPLAEALARPKKIIGAKATANFISFPVTPIEALRSRNDAQTESFIDGTQSLARTQKENKMITAKTSNIAFINASPTLSERAPEKGKESIARATLEALAKAPFVDSEWDRMRARLLEFVSILRTWQQAPTMRDSELLEAA